MIFRIAQYLESSGSALHGLSALGIRAACCFVSTFFLFLLLGQWFIRFSKRRFSSKVREYVPETHQVKNSTPTMGGLLIVALALLNILLWTDLAQTSVWVFLLSLISFSAIGFLDDWAKVTKKKGVLAGQKFKLQVLASCVVVLVWYYGMHPNTQLCIPFFKNYMPQLGLFLIPWAIFILVAMSNAVNLTDGLDGLATTQLITSFSTFSLIAYCASSAAWAEYFSIPFANCSELVVCGAALLGALFGFLWFNAHPAQIFMGDVGSLAFGGVLALMALMARQELLLVIVGGIFVLETLSVVIQVLYFKKTGKRVFKMAPIHHHFELLGLHETKITMRFFIVSVVLSLGALLTLNFR
jgi:phospho-N-acetylmuramoyl-pentapeptide-transferase